MSTAKSGKATPRPWIVISGLSTLINSGGVRKEPWRSVASTHVYKGKTTAEDEANAQLIMDAVNSYNPERDKLARELAISLLNGACPCLCRACGHSIRLARQLLRLYPEDK